MKTTAARVELLSILLLGIGGVGCNADRQSGFQLFQQNPTEEWTIFCCELTGPYHDQNCASMAQSLRQTPGISPNAVSCDDDSNNQISRLYYGSYRRKVDADTGRRELPTQLRRDLQLIHSLGDDQSRRFFTTARTVPRVRPAGSSNPEWELTGADGSYSLQIAVFYPEAGFSESRRAAVALVAELRKEGFEAYYYHGDVQSMVTVGSFDESALIPTESGTPMLSAKVRALQASDPRFKHNYENGEVVTKRFNGTKFPSRSFLVRIPRPQDFGSRR